MLFQKEIQIKSNIEDIINNQFNKLLYSQDFDDEDLMSIQRYLEDIAPVINNTKHSFRKLELKGTNSRYYLIEITYHYQYIHSFTIEVKNYSSTLNKNDYVECIIDNIAYYVNKQSLLDKLSSLEYKSYDIENYGL